MRSDIFYRAFLTGLKLEIGKMRWIKKSEEPDWHASEDDTQYATAIMRLAHHKKRLAFATNTDDAAAVTDDNITEKAAQFVRRFPGNWREPTIVYYEWEGESETREQAVDRAFSNLLEIGFHVLGDPASNKWFTVWQLFNNLVLMMSFHKVFVAAWRHASNVTHEEADEDMSDFTDEEALGIDSAKAWHRRERRRDLKGLQWIESSSGNFLGMMFLFVSSRVTALHFYYFKEAHTLPYGSEVSPIFDLCDDARSRPVAVMNELLSLLQPSAAADWGVVEMRFGRFSKWPTQWKRAAHESVIALIGGLIAQFPA